MRRLPLVLLFSIGISALAEAQTVYLKPEEALRVLFRDSEEVVSEKKTLTQDQKKFVEGRLQETLRKAEWNFFIAKTHGKLDGYALIDSEIGKTEPITFITAITPGGSVQEVEILVYREPIGSEIRGKRFLSQYRGKRLGDPIRVGQDIKNMAGATMSSRAVSKGVKRDLLLWQVFYGK